MNIVYGGAFNPPTLGHYRIASRLLKMEGIENLILLPVGLSYKKKNLISDQNRLDMVNLMADELNCSVSDCELFQTEYLGTLHTLNNLSKTYPNLSFVIGADNLNNLDKWIQYEKLLTDYRVIVVTREGIDCEKMILEKYPKFSDHFTIIRMNLAVSSSMVREDVESNKDLLRDNIYDYIVKNKLYGVIKCTKME